MQLACIYIYIYTEKMETTYHILHCVHPPIYRVQIPQGTWVLIQRDIRCSCACSDHATAGPACMHNREQPCCGNHAMTSTILGCTCISIAIKCQCKPWTRNYPGYIRRKIDSRYYPVFYSGHYSLTLTLRQKTVRVNQVMRNLIRGCTQGVR